MNYKRIASILAIIAGAAFFFGSMYIQNQVDQGKEQIRSAQKTVDQTNTLFSLSPATKDVGQTLMGGAQKKIDAGSAEAAYYEKMANQLRIIGIVLAAAGIGLFFFSRKKS